MIQDMLLGVVMWFAIGAVGGWVFLPSINALSDIVRKEDGAMPALQGDQVGYLLFILGAFGPLGFAFAAMCSIEIGLRKWRARKR